jgi:anti-anti-sigma factor
VHPVIVRESRTGGRQTLYPVGELDAVVADRFEMVVAAALTDERLTGVVVDLSAVTFLDCAGVGALVASRQSAQRAAKAFDVIGATGLPRRVLQLTGTLTTLRVTPPVRTSQQISTPLAA